MMTNREGETMDYKDAKARTLKVKSFYKSIVTYLVVNLVLLIINLVTSPENLWFYWVLIFWGIAIGVQAIRLFIFPSASFGKEWEERKIDEYMKKDARDVVAAEEAKDDDESDFGGDAGDGDF